MHFYVAASVGKVLASWNSLIICPTLSLNPQSSSQYGKPGFLEDTDTYAIEDYIGPMAQTLLDFSTSSSWMSQPGDGRAWIPTKSLEPGEKLEGGE